jgi:hypothetical protein
MGVIDTMAMNGALWNAVLPGPAEALWAFTMLALAVSAIGIVLGSLPTPRPRRRRLRLAVVEAH